MIFVLYGTVNIDVQVQYALTVPHLSPLCRNGLVFVIQLRQAMKPILSSGGPVPQSLNHRPGVPVKPHVETVLSAIKEQATKLPMIYHSLS